jgi:glucokinase
MSDWVIGVDLGGTKTALGLISPDNRVVAHRRMPTDADEGPRSVVERIAQLVAELEAELPAGEKVAGLGICCPGPVDHVTGTLLTLVNVPGLSNTPLRQLLADRLNLPIRLEHDAKAAALGDFYYGAGRGRNNMVYVVIGTGVGGAIIIDGHLHYGESNSSGEIGHMTVNPGGEPCHCGSRGCLETYTSGPRLVRRYQQALERAGRTAGEQPLSGELIAHLAAQGDPVALQIMTEAGEALGIAVASTAMMLNIELYVIGGSVAKTGNLLIEPARRTVPRFCFRAVGARVQIIASELGDDGPILGCGWLARHAAASA